MTDSVIVTSDFIRHVRTPSGVRYFHEPIGSPIGKGHGIAAAVKKVFPEISRSDFSNPDTPRTRAVTSAEFQKLAAEGKARLAEFEKNASDPEKLDVNFDEIKNQAWDATREKWGGATFDAHTGAAVTGSDEKYAMTIRSALESGVTLPIGADRARFDKAMDAARRRFSAQLRNQKSCLGVFRDEDSIRIDIDPVLVVDNLHDVDTIGSYTHAVGGAYGFHDGNGYWPPYVKEV